MALKKISKEFKGLDKNKSGEPKVVSRPHKVQKQQVSVTYQKKRSKHYPQKNMRRLQQLKEKDLSREKQFVKQPKTVAKKVRTYRKVK